MQDITVEKLFSSKNYIPVDVRSPIEHKEANIPGSVNIPLFSDDERKEIGIIYKNLGSEAAKWRAMEIVAPKLPALLQRIKELKLSGREPVIHCWRGGDRSKSVASFLELSGIPATRLSGGYRAYREYILEKIPQLLPEKAVVLHGLTGTGKTTILHHLQKMGYPVIDLEKMANHRGSLFGTVGIGDGHNQKTFDALLFQRLAEMADAGYFIIEAESKRIGRAVQPDLMAERKIEGEHFYINCSLENRIERIYEEYVAPYRSSDWFKIDIETKTEKIIKRIKPAEMGAVLKQAMEIEDYRTLIRVLLEHYYDSRYIHSLSEYKGTFTEVNGEDSRAAAEQIAIELQKKQFLAIGKR